MCFSPEASFAVGGALIPAGVYCVHAARAKSPRLVPVALVPFAFAAQQIAEGFVWLGLQAGDPVRTHAASLVFLFFALAFWPWWFSAANIILDPRPARKWVFVGLAVLTSVWFWVMFFPLLVGPESLLSVKVVHHSLAYSYFDLAVFTYVPGVVLRVLYLLSIAVPMALGPPMFGRRTTGLLIGLVVGSVVVAAAVYDYAFNSVWCFFAAVLTGLLCVLFYQFPARAPVRMQPGTP